jgi:hypothetical protein
VAKHVDLADRIGFNPASPVNAPRMSPRPQIVAATGIDAQRRHRAGGTLLALPDNGVALNHCSGAPWALLDGAGTPDSRGVEQAQRQAVGPARPVRPMRCT